MIPDQPRFAVFADWLMPGSGRYTLAAWAKDCELLADLGVADVVLGLSPRHLGRDATDVAAAVEVARACGLASWLMIWAHRDRDRLHRDLPRLAALARDTIAGVVLDCEGPWVRGTWDAQAAAEYVDGELDGLVWAVTSLADCPPSLRPLARLCPLCLLQAYSVHEPDGSLAARRAQARDPSRLRRIVGDPAPGLQRRSWQSWTAAGAEGIELALAAYWLTRPGVTAEQTWSAQLGEARRLGCGRVWLWSGRWIVGSRRMQRLISAQARGMRQ